jgi:hypothetical protein
MGKLFKGSLLGGFILFLWGAVSWMVLDWHSQVLNAFTDEAKVAESFQLNTDKAGVYMLPMIAMSLEPPEKLSEAEQQQMATREKGPVAFATVIPEGHSNDMIKPLVTSLATQIIAAFLVTALLLINTPPSFMGRLTMVMLFAVGASVITYVPLYNWFYFPLDFTLLAVADILIGWLLAGIAISWVTKPVYPRFR